MDERTKDTVRWYVLLACFVVAIVAFFAAGIAAAQVPANANIYRITLRQEAQRVWGPAAPVATLAAQITQESGWRASVTARDGGMGLPQFMPATLRWACNQFAAELDGEPCDPYRPRVGLRLQSLYLKTLHEGVAHADDACSRMGFALMDYNSGKGWRLKRQAKSPEPGNVWATAPINPGVTPANQWVAQDYPVRILRCLEPAFVAAGWGQGACNAH